MAILHTPGPMTAKDFDFLQSYLTLMRDAIITTDPSPATVPTASPPPPVRTGPAIWRNKDVDQPVTVTGYWGENGGRHYARIEGSGPGVPLDELAYESEGVSSF